MSLSPQAKVSIFSIFSIKNVIKVRFISGKYFLNGWKAILRNSYKNHSFFWEVRFRLVTCVVFVPKCHMLTTYAHLEMCAWWFENCCRQENFDLIGVAYWLVPSHYIQNLQASIKYSFWLTCLNMLLIKWFSPQHFWVLNVYLKPILINCLFNCEAPNLYNINIIFYIIYNRYRYIIYIYNISI